MFKLLGQANIMAPQVVNTLIGKHSDTLISHQVSVGGDVLIINIENQL